MLRLIGAAAVLALAAANPALAQGKGNGGGNDGGKGKGGEQAAMERGPGNSGAGKSAERGREKSDRPDRSAIRDLERGNGGGKDRSRIVERMVPRDRDIDRDVRRAGWDSDADWDGRGRAFAAVPGCPPGLAKKGNGCLPPGLARGYRDDDFGWSYRPALFGIPLRTRADYAYHNGYLIPVSGGSGLSYIPLLGGALAVGQLWPQAYPSLELAEWQRSYYGFEDPRGYRYADNVVYRTDPETAAIQSVAALLTGNDFVVGQRMPLGYDVYNVPGPYQARYYDTDDALYRYADGRVYEIDPTTQLIAAAIDLVV